MSRQLHQSQYILQKCFDNRQNILRVSMSNAQDYLNAIYDGSKDALRVNMVGGMLPLVDDPTEMPGYGNNGQICPVYNAESNVIDFYEWDDSTGKWEFRGSTVADESGGGSGGSGLNEDEKEAVEWVVDHIDQLKEVADFNYIVNVSDVFLDPNSNVVEVQGQMQVIDDDLDGDSDDTTPYRIDFSGYVLGVSTYADADSPVPDHYYTKITYEAGTGGLGTSHIYLQQDEYDYFAGLPNGKNLLRVFYLTNAMTTPVKRRRLVLNVDGTATDEEGNNYVISDADDSDGDHSTQYCIDVGGYVLGVETYESENALVPDKTYVKTAYESDGVHSGRSHIYMDAVEFDTCAGYGNGKNIIDIYYLHTVFPASVTISEVQYLFPSNSVDYVVVDAAGNIKNVSDEPDKDGDPSTHVRITVNGYALDMDGYYGDDDQIKHRLLVKMSYNHQSDTTDIYMEREQYEYVSSLREGRNVVSIYTVGAGIGVDASRIGSGSRVHIWKGTKESLVELEAVANPENGDTWQVGSKEYSWNGLEWIELGDNSECVKRETQITHVNAGVLSVSAGNCYHWTVPSSVNGTISFNGTADTMGVAYVDIVLGDASGVSGSNVVLRQNPVAGMTNHCRVDFDGTTARLYVLDSY